MIVAEARRVLAVIVPTPSFCAEGEEVPVSVVEMYSEDIYVITDLEER